MSTTERTVRTPMGNVSVLETDGKGLPVVMLHGSGSSKEVFRPQFESPLGEIYRLVALDLPGHGQSDDAAEPERAYSIVGLAETVSAVMEGLGLERSVVFGWSLGGHIAIELMSRRDGIAGLMLSGTPPLGRGPLASFRGFQTSWDLLLASKERFTARDAVRFQRLCFGDRGDDASLAAILRADGRLRSTVIRSMMRGDGVDQKRAVEEARIPIAMVNGAEDSMVRLPYVASLRYGTLWEHHCHVIPATGHAPFSQAPEVFNRLFHRFLKDMAVTVPLPLEHGFARRA